MIELNGQLNGTYLWYGAQRQRGAYRKNQVEQDRNAFKQLGTSGLSSRANVKSGSAYGNRGRDLVDTLKTNKNILSELKDEHLPEQLQKLPASKRSQAVLDMSKKREEIQKEIAKVNRQREKYISDEKSKQAKGEAGASTLGDAVQSAIREQLHKSGFEFSK